MKYLIVAKSRRNQLLDPGKASLPDMLDARDKMHAAKASGVIEGVYALVAGGSVWIVNADSHESLARTLRKYQLSDAADVEVIPVIDAFSVLDERIEHISTTPGRANGSPGANHSSLRQV